MLKFELQKAADKLINEIFAVKKGETVVITADTISDEGLVDAVAASVYSVGGFPMVITIATPGGVGKAADPDIPVDALTGALLGADLQQIADAVERQPHHVEPAAQIRHRSGGENSDMFHN